LSSYLCAIAKLVVLADADLLWRLSWSAEIPGAFISTSGPGPADLGERGILAIRIVGTFLPTLDICAEQLGADIVKPG
jgi:hypothetical protein